MTGQGTNREWLRGVSLMALAMLPLAPALAEDPATTDSAAARPASAVAPGERAATEAALRYSGRRSYRDLFVRRAAPELESLSAFQRTITPGQQLVDHALFDELERGVRKDAERALRRAAAEYVLENSDLGRLIRRAEGHETGEVDHRGDWGFSFGFYRALPRVKATYALESSEVDVTLGAAGTIGVGFKPSRWSGTRVSAAYGDGEYTLSLRADF